MKTFTKHILLLALMLFGVAGAAWATRAPQKFTGPVAYSDLVVGDTLAPGFSFTGFGSSQALDFEGNRHKQNGVLWDNTSGFNGNRLSGYGVDNPVAMIAFDGNSTFTPVDESGQDGNAWVVTITDDNYVRISGITISITPDPTVPALDETTGNWNFLMPGSNKVVKAVLLDSIVLGPHVSVAVQPVQAFISYTRPGIGGDSTVLYYDPTLANSSFGFIANDDDGQGRNFAFWADDQNNHNTDRDFSGFSELTCGQRFVAVYPDNHTLTLATPQGGGTLELAGVTYDTVYNINFYHIGSPEGTRSFTIPASRLSYDTTFSYGSANVMYAEVDEQSGKLSIINRGDHTVSIRISGAFGYGSYRCRFEGMDDPDEWVITCTAGTQPKMPYGISKTGDNTYSVMEGLTVNVTATPDSAHYLSAIGNEAVISNSAYNISFTMPDDDAELAATFTTKPTLTLAQTDGGTLEAIVPQGGVTAMHLTTDQIPTWSGNTEYAMAADLQQFGFVAVDSAAAAAWTGAPASGFITLVYALAGNQFKTIVFQDGQWFAATTFDFYKADFYTSPDVFYFTTGASKSNVIASSTPNTYYIDYGTPVTVKATPDAEHYLVSFSDDAPAPERNSNLAVEKTYDSVIAPINLTANFQAKPTLTLTANDGGTLTLDGVTPGATTYNITIEGSEPITVTAADFPYHTTVFLHEGLYDVGSGQYPLSAVKNGDNAAITISEPYGGDRSVSYTYIDNENFISGHKNISCQSVESAPTMPAGVVSANATLDTFVVDYGTDVTVIATPDSIHYLATLGDVTMGSNTAKDTTFAVTATTNLAANFELKPTLTLAHNDGGEMEVIPAGGLTAIVPPTDQIALWEGNYAGNLAENDLPATLGFVAVDQAAAEAWTGAPASGNAMLIYDIDGEYFHYLSFNNGSLTGNDEGTSTPGGFYQMASAGTLYITTGVTPGNVTATAEPNTYYIDYNTSVTVKATPAKHYHLQGWSCTPGTIVDNLDSTATLTMTQNETVSATFAQNAPELTWEYDDVILANGDTLSAYHGFEMDTIAKLIFSSNDEFFDAYMNALQNTGTSLLRFGSSNTNVVSFANPFDPQSLSVNAPGTATVYMVHDGSVMAYDSAYFTAVILAPDTLTLVHNDGGTLEAIVPQGGGEETLLTTVTATSKTTSSQSPDGIVTVTLNNIKSYSSEYGWYFGGIVTVEAAQGYTITRCVFKQYPNSFPNRVLVDDLAPFTATMADNDGNYYVSAATSHGDAYGDASMNGISTIEVYGYASADSVRAIVADTTYAVVPGANVTVKATPDSAHYLVNWDNDAAIYSNTDTTKHYVVNGNVTSTATFNAKPVLTLAQNENWGTVGLQMVGGSGVAQLTDSTYMIDYGTEVTVQAEAITLHHIAGWISEDSVAYPADSITYGNYFITEPDSLFPALSMLTFKVTADTTAEALFGLNSYDVFATAQLDDRDEIGSGLAMGRIAVIYTNVEGSVQGAGPADTLTYTAQGGSTSMLVVNSSYGYDFSGWYDVAADTLLSDAAMLSLTAAATVEARFVPDTFEVSAVVAVPGDTLAAAGTVTGAARYAYREMVTLEETPATGYHFVNWTAADSSVVGTDDSLTLQLVKDTVLTANFDTNVYNVVADVNIEGLGTVTGAGEVKHFLSTTLVATANLKYHFVMWVNAAGDSVSAADTLEVFPVGDTALTAVFDTNIYATVWSGETDTTYTSLPYEGLTATYTDFWGNEHTPVLTFVCGDQTVVTPNYPVTAGTWTVTATGAEGDSLTAPETTLTIKRAIVNVTGAVVETAKFADGTTTAVVTNAGTLNNVQGSDRVQHTTTAAYNTATVGDNKTITVTYALNGAAALLANYTLTPTTEVYTTEGYIIEPMVPNTDRPEDDTTVVEQGFDVYAYGYCTGSGYSIRYHLNTGAPDQYKLDFADSRFTDVDWTNLATPGADGTIDIMVPVDMPMGDYSVTVTFRDSRFTWLESAPMTMNFHINLPETFTMPLFNNVIALVDTCQCFSDIQWYHRANSSEEWKAIPGANGYYYHATDAELEGEFFVKAKYNGVETFTCPQTDMETLYTDDEQTVSVTAYPNPTTDGVTITVDGGTEWVHTLRVLSTVGVEKESRTFEGFTTTVDMRGYAKGAYMVIVDGVVVRVVRN